MTTHAAPTTPGDRSIVIVVGVLSFAIFMTSLDLFIVNLAFPYIGREYPGTSLSSLSWVLVAGLVTFSVGSLACGLAPGVSVLIAARVVQAIGGGAMVPASLSILLATVPAAARPQAIGTWSALGALGAALGPVIGGLLVQASWRWVFWINLPVGLAAIALALRTLPESRDERVQIRPDLLGATLLAASVGLVALALVKAPDWGWGSPRFLGGLAAALACAAAAVVRSHRHPAPVIELGLLRSRMFSGTFAASLLYYAGFSALVLNSVEFLTGVWHYSALRAGLAIAPGPLMVLPFARLVAPRLVGRLGGPGRVAVLGCLVGVASQVLWLTRIQAHPAYLTHFLPIQLIGGIGVGLTIPSFLSAGSASLPPARFGTGSGVLNTARQIGTVLGVAGLVAILAQAGHTDPVATFREGTGLVAVFGATAGLTAAVFLTRRARSAPAPVVAVAEPGRR